MNIKDNKNIYDPGYSLGIISAQSITQPLTQDSLSFFHKTGAKNETIENIKKFQELTQAINNNDTSICDVIIEKKKNTKEIYSMLVYKRFWDLIEKIKKIDTKEYKNYWINNNLKKYYSNILEITIYKQYQYIYMNLNSIKNIIIKHLNVMLNDAFLIINSPEHISKILILYNNNIIDGVSFKNIKICGIDNIIDIINIEEDHDSINVKTKGSNLNLILSNKNVDKIKSTSNNIKDVYDTLGIESARKILLKELSNILNINHALILVDCMTILGDILSVNSKGYSKIDKGFLSNISYENSIKTLKRNIPFGVHEHIDNINKKMIIGKMPNVGTGCFSLCKKLYINIFYINKNDEIYININNNSIIIKKNIFIIIDVRNFKKDIKKITYSSYKVNSNLNVMINKIIFTILKVSINKNMDIDFVEDNCLKIIIKDLDSLKYLSYEIIQGNNIFEVSTEGDLLLDKIIIPDYKYKLNIKNLKYKEDNNIKLTFKSKNKLSSKIIIDYTI